jgi:hypothetical protein
MDQFTWLPLPVTSETPEGPSCTSYKIKEITQLPTVASLLLPHDTDLLEPPQTDSHVI